MAVLDDVTWRQDPPASTFQAEAPRRKLRGLRFPVVPTGAWLAQVGGGIAALTGSFMQFGAPITLIVAGLASVMLGTLREAGRI